MEFSAYAPAYQTVIQYNTDQYLTLYVQFWAPDDGRKTRLKHVKRLT